MCVYIYTYIQLINSTKCNFFLKNKKLADTKSMISYNFYTYYLAWRIFYIKKKALSKWWIGVISVRYLFEKAKKNKVITWSKCMFIKNSIANLTSEFTLLTKGTGKINQLHNRVLNIFTCMKIFKQWLSSNLFMILTVLAVAKIRVKRDWIIFAVVGV